MCHPGPVRVATFNILHGVPLRDVPADDPAATDGGGRRRRRARGGGSALLTEPSSDDLTQIDPAFDGEQLGENIDQLPDDIDPTQVKVGGADPTRRVQWSPTVSDPAELLRAIEELQQDGPLDVIALQEVDLRQPRTGLVDQAALVADAIGAAHWRFVPAILGIPGIAAEGADWVPATAADDDPTEPGAAIRSGADPAGAGRRTGHSSESP